MAKTDVWMPIFIGDYIADTMDLTTEQHGAYMLLLMRHWMKGPIPDNDETLSSIAKMSMEQWLKTRGLFLGYFSVIDGFWTNKRAVEEKAKADAFRDKQSCNGSKGGRPKSPNKPKLNPEETQTKAKAKPNETPSPSPSHISKENKFSSDDLMIAELIHERVSLITKSTKRPNFESWANEIRLMRESDNRTIQEIRATFLWANQDSFWKANILSPPSLRKSFDKLFAKMNSEIENATNQPIPIRSTAANRNFIPDHEDTSWAAGLADELYVRQ